MKKDRRKIRLKRKMKSKEPIYIHPMLPTKYSRLEKQRIKELEKELLKVKVLKI